MKRILLLFATTAIPLWGLTQPKPSLNKAYNYYYDKNYVKAKEIIDACTTDEKLSGKAQTWLYKGNICYLLATEEYSLRQKDEHYTVRFPDAPVEAYDAFIKSQELNPRMEAMDMFTADQALPQLYPLLLVRGVDLLIAKDYPNAKSTLAKGISSYETAKPKYPMHGDLYYYYAYTLEAMGDTADVKEYYTKAIGDGSTNAYVYVRLIESYKKEGNKMMAQGILADGKRNLPGNIKIQISEIDYYYWSGDTATADRLLQSLPVDSLKSADEAVNVANFYIQAHRYGEAVDLLTRAQGRNGNNFVVLYNLGVCYYSISEQYFRQYNESALDGQAESAEYKDKSDKYLNLAAQYFEQARTIDPTDLNLLYTLKSIYVRQQSAKTGEIEKEINKIEQK